MEKNKNVPEIRFQGFTDEWGRKPLGKIGNTYTGLCGKTKVDFGHGEAKYITYMNIFSNPVSKRDMTKPIEIDNNQNTVQFGDIFFTTSSETPKEVGMSSVWLENLENVYLNSFCFGYRPTLKLNSYFFTYMLRSPTFRKKIIYLAQGISRYNISKTKVMDIIISISKIDEQTKIGTYFKNFDKLITLKQCKLDKLKSVKKSMLEKMFPREGATVPEIRFQGFSGEWKQGRLNDFIKPSSEKNTFGKYSKKDVLSVSGDVGIVNQIEFQGRSFAGSSVVNYGVVLTGDVVYTKSPLKKNPFGIIKTNMGEPGIVSTLYAVYKTKENIYPQFVQFYFDFDYRLNKYLKPLVNKGAKNDMKVTNKNALLGQVIFPNYSEQKKIALYLNQLNNLISHQQKEIEKLKQIKTSCLSKMFV